MKSIFSTFSQEPLSLCVSVFVCKLYYLQQHSLFNRFYYATHLYSGCYALSREHEGISKRKTTKKALLHTRNKIGDNDDTMIVRITDRNKFHILIALYESQGVAIFPLFFGSENETKSCFVLSWKENHTLAHTHSFTF